MLVQQGILAYLFIVLVAVTGPYALVQGAEAQRRLGATLTRKMPAMRLAGHAKWSALTAVLGAFGLVVMGGVVGGGLWEIAAGLERTAESGHPAGVLGGVAGFVVTGLLVRRVRVGRFQRIRLLKGLLSPR